VKILFVSGYFPWPLTNGGCQRRYHLVDNLARRNDVTLVALAPEGPAVPGWGECPLRRSCREVIEFDARTLVPASSRRFEGWAPISERFVELVSSPSPSLFRYWNSARKLIRFFRDMRRRKAFDVVWVDRSYFAHVVRRAGFDNIVVDIDDIQSVFLARLLWHGPWYRSKVFHYAELAKLYMHERALTRRFDRLVVCKERDRHFFGSLCYKVSVVPNGVADGGMASPANERPGEILYMGTMDYDPNIDAARYFARDILPRVRAQVDHANFHIVGKDPDPSVRALHDGKTCLVHGMVPDVGPYYESASLVVAPIRQGSGTRLKVLEALAKGKALVSTSTGAEGLDLRPGRDIEIADDPARFADACVRLLANPKIRRQMGASGRERVLELYHWDKIGAVAESILRRHAIECGRSHNGHAAPHRDIARVP
jgi:glycosyltransferase involved in cell wall biosynthesis